MYLEPRAKVCIITRGPVDTVAGGDLRAVRISSRADICYNSRFPNRKDPLGDTQISIGQMWA